MTTEPAGALFMADGISARPFYDFPPPDAFFAQPATTVPPAGVHVFNVQDFGAVADAGIDNQPMIQAAIDAAHASGGGIVYIPPGTYGVGTNPDGNGCLHLLDNVFLKGAGMGETSLRLMDGTSGIVTGMVRSPASEGTTNWGLSDLAIDGNKAHTTAQVDGFYTGPRPGSTIQDQDVYVLRVDVHDVSRYGFDPHEQTARLSIKDSVAHGNGVDGFVLDFNFDAEVTGNASYGNGRHGFNVVTSSQDILLSNNVAHDNGSGGIVVQRGSENITSSHDITISGGSSYANGGEGVLVQTATNVTISGMDLHDNGTNGVRVLGGSHVTVSGNTIHDNSHNQNDGYSEVDISAYVDTVFGKTYSADFNLVEGNTISATHTIEARYGVEEHAGSVTGNVFLDNTVTGTVRGPYALAGTDMYALKLGTAGNDTIAGSSAQDHIIGGDGADTLSGLDGNDLIEGGNGADLISGGKGDDTILGGAGNDTVTGDSGNDLISGDAGDDSLSGGTGNDWLSGGFGNDILSGGSGDDILLADAGNDHLDGGSGFDTADFSGITNGVVVDLYAKTATGAGIDTIASIEKVVGTAFADILSGDNNANTLVGGAGRDILRGLGGADTLTGGSGSDTFVWGSTKDVILSTGVYLGLDHITDFGGGDSLDLHGLIGTQTYKTINDLVHVTDMAAGAMVSVKIGGAFLDVVQLDGHHEFSAASMVAAGHMLV